MPDVQADHLRHTGLVHGVRDDQRLGYDPAVISDLDVLRVEPEVLVLVGACQRPLTEPADPLIQATTHDALTRSFVMPLIPSSSTSRSTFRVLTQLT